MPAWLEDAIAMDVTVLQVVGVVLVLAVLLFIIAAFRRARRRHEAEYESQDSRIAILASTVVDERRRLVLLRRDNVEHLVLIGGPTDVVVESNIGLPRTQAPQQSPQQSPQQRAPGAPQRPTAPQAQAPAAPAMPQELRAPAMSADTPLTADIPSPLPAEPRASEPPRTSELIARPRMPAAAEMAPVAPMAPAAVRADERGASAPETRVAAQDATPPFQSPEGRPAEPRRADQQTAAAARLTPSGRREPSLTLAPAPARLNAAGPAAVVPVNPPAQTRERPASAAAVVPARPAPQAAPPITPQSDPNTIDIEGEIGALTFEPFPHHAFPSGPKAASPAAPAARNVGAVADPGTTLGDLAEKLEAALARDIVSKDPEAGTPCRTGSDRQRKTIHGDECLLGAIETDARLDGAAKPVLRVSGTAEGKLSTSGIWRIVTRGSVILEATIRRGPLPWIKFGSEILGENSVQWRLDSTGGEGSCGAAGELHD